MKDKFELMRSKMVKQQLISRGINDKNVLKIMEKVPRHLFVSEKYQQEAYQDYPLPIDAGQTISQPYIVGLMTQLLNLSGREKVLEIGTGSGYQSAILAELCAQLYTIERIPELTWKAKSILQQLGYNNIMFKTGDGSQGWEEFSPFDRIIVTAGVPEIPFPLINQLSSENGIMVIPVGERYSQELLKVTKINNEIKTENYGGCIFVPLIGKYSWPEG